MSESDSEPYNHEKDDINRNKLVIGEGKKKKRKSSLKKPKKRKKRVTIVNNAPHSAYTNIPNPRQTRRKQSTFDSQELHQLKDQMMRQKYSQSIKQALQASQPPPEVVAAQQAQRQLIAAQKASSQTAPALSHAPLAVHTDIEKKLKVDKLQELVAQLKETKKDLEAIGKKVPSDADHVIRRTDHKLRLAMNKFSDDPNLAQQMVNDTADDLKQDMENLFDLRATQAWEGDLPEGRPDDILQTQKSFGTGLLMNAPQQTVSYDKTVQQAPTRRSAQMGQYLTSSSMAPRQYLLKSTGSGAMDDAIEIVGRGLSGELISGGEGVFESVLKGIGTWLLNRGKTAYRDRKEELWREKHYPKQSGSGLKIHGLYCGPNWTSGKVLAAQDAVDSDWSVQPIDDLDAACKVHDFQCGKVGPEGCSKADDLALVSKAMAASKTGTPWKRAKALAVASAIKAASLTRGHGKWNPPKSPSGRKKMLDKFGNECFLEPNKLKYPICNPQGKVSKKGVDAAIFRAAQSHNTKVEAKARAIKSKLGEGRNAERDYARKQGVSPELLHWIGDGGLRSIKKKGQDRAFSAKLGCALFPGNPACHFG